MSGLLQFILLKINMADEHQNQPFALAIAYSARNGKSLIEVIKRDIGLFTDAGYGAQTTQSFAFAGFVSDPAGEFQTSAFNLECAIELALTEICIAHNAVQAALSAYIPGLLYQLQPDPAKIKSFVIAAQ